MKCKLLTTLLVVGVLAGYSPINESKRRPATYDVGVVGEGEVKLYYQEGDDIIVKVCDPLTVLKEMTPEEARSNCKGESNKIPVNSFKRYLRNLITTDRAYFLKPLSLGEVLAYNRNGLNPEQIETMEVEFKELDNFVRAYGIKNATRQQLDRRDELLAELRLQETRISAIKKIHAEIEKVVDLIAKNELTLTKFHQNKETFLYTVLKEFNPSREFPCGLKGSVAERIEDCSYQLTSEKEGFVLVSRSKRFKEVYKDVSSGLLWSDRLARTMNYEDAKNACKTTPPEVAGIKSLTWRIPSQDEYKEAEKNGIKNALPNMNYWFWSSSRSSIEQAWIFVGGSDGYNGGKGYYWSRYSNLMSTRCVAR